MSDTLALLDPGSPQGTASAIAPVTQVAMRAPTPAREAAPADPWDSSDLMKQTKSVLLGGEGAHGNARAQNPYSSAGGLYQITDGTWTAMMRKYHPDLVQGKSDIDIKAMKYDPALNTRVAAELTHDSAKSFISQGLPVTPQTLAAAHRLGVGGAQAALHATPETPLAQVAPDVLSKGNEDISGLTVAQFLQNPYPGRHGGGGGGAQPVGQGIPPGVQAKLDESSRNANDILSKMMGEDAKAKKVLDKEVAGYKPFEVGPPPQKPDTDPLKSFGSIATIFATLAAGLSKTPAVAAMNGLAGALTGAQNHDWAEYQDNYRKWKDGTEYALKMHEQQSSDIRNALEMLQSNSARGTAMLRANAAAYNDPILAKLAVEGDFEKLHQMHMERNEQAQRMAKAQPEVEASLHLSAATAAMDAAQKSGDPAQIQQAQQNYDTALKRLQDVKSAGFAGRPGSLQNQEKLNFAKQWKADHPEASDVDAMDAAERHYKEVTAAQGTVKDRDTATLAEGEFEKIHGRAPVKGNKADDLDMANLRIKTRVNSGASLDDEGAAWVADQALLGNHEAMTGLARNSANITKVLNTMVARAKALGISPEEANVLSAQYKGIVSGERTLGTRAANMGIAANEAKLMAPIALDRSEAVSRTEFPTLNSAILAADRGTGGVAITRFISATNALVTSYAKFLNPNGVPTDSDKDRARDMLATHWSKDQFRAQVETMLLEIKTGAGAVNDTRQEFREGIIGGHSGAGQGAQTVRDVASEPDYRALDHGAWYRKPGDPPDSHRVKP